MLSGSLKNPFTSMEMVSVNLKRPPTWILSYESNCIEEMVFRKKEVPEKQQVDEEEDSENEEVEEEGNEESSEEEDEKVEEEEVEEEEVEEEEVEEEEDIVDPDDATRGLASAAPRRSLSTTSQCRSRSTSPEEARKSDRRRRRDRK
ncbi:hypothetical protein NPIL_155811 [Nephila pilipes]|uniref:Uncharacterized protein n=1 Tax=Nephila pilipes TaxID=299642 RepID=A0A8X6IR37_NEPPI|nr:hypothetical protein NPIL_155811 [Nephila pilipes]